MVKNFHSVRFPRKTHNSILTLQVIQETRSPPLTAVTSACEKQQRVLLFVVIVEAVELQYLSTISSGKYNGTLFKFRACSPLDRNQCYIEWMKISR